MRTDIYSRNFLYVQRTAKGISMNKTYNVEAIFVSDRRELNIFPVVIAAAPQGG